MTTEADDLEDAPRLLPFQQDLLEQLLPQSESEPSASSSALTHSETQQETNALLILARGLGMRAIVAQLLKLYDQPRNSSGRLVLLVNATEEEEKGLSEEVGMKLRAIGHELPATQREALYAHGGLLSVTSRILVVDMLNKRLPAEQIAGMVVLHAEEVTPTSNEAFVVRCYRNANKTGFLKAFSDQPEAFTGFSPLTTVLQQLKIRQVILCPRFAGSVEKDLKKRQADVIEFYQPLSEAMAEIQSAVLECMEATLAEIRRSNTTLDIEDFTVENALFRNFDALVRRQLDPVWHKVGQTTKGLVNDLTDLRRLNQLLLTLDCVSYNRFLETMLTSATFNKFGGRRKEHSPWMMTPAADRIFTVARERVYRQVVEKEKEKEKVGEKGKGKAGVDEDGIPLDLEEDDWGAEEERLLREMEQYGDTGSPSAEGATKKPKSVRWAPKGVEPVLEEQPKWSLLQEVLDEIEQHIYWGPEDEGPCTDTILVMCGSAQTCASIGEYLSATSDGDTGPEGPGHAMLLSKLEGYFYWKATLSKIQKSVKGTTSNSGSGGSFRTDGRSSFASSSSSAAPNQSESAAVKRKAEWQKGGRGQPSGKRRRVRGGGNVQVTSSSAEEKTFKGPPGADPAKLEEEATRLAEDMAANRAAGGPLLPDIILDDDDSPEVFSALGFDDYFGLISSEDLVVVRSYNDDDDDKVLEELRPRYIVMYDPDPAFVRRIEAYRAAHVGLDVRVYFLMYKDSVEEQRYLSGIRKEKDAFERLIKEKGSMVIAHEAEYRPDDEESSALRTLSTRVGGKQVTRDPPRVIIDVREFRSALPSLLHADQFEIVPVTITIGDYILSPEIAVERKSIPDLISSFSSGRLFQQCELLTQHYKQPVLLIEFDQKKSFNLENYVEAKPNEGPQPRNPTANDTDLRAKLVLLALSFPTLRILWSSSPYQTVDLFRELKLNRPEPDAERAMLVGADVSEGGVEAEGEAGGNVAGGEAGFSATSQEVLRSLPGVNTRNYRQLMAKSGSLVGLCGMESAELGAIVGSDQGKKLHAFLHKDIRVE